MHAGDCLVIPPNVEHGGVAGPQGCRALDVLTPPRAGIVHLMAGYTGNSATAGEPAAQGSPNSRGPFDAVASTRSAGRTTLLTRASSAIAVGRSQTACEWAPESGENGFLGGAAAPARDESRLGGVPGAQATNLWQRAGVIPAASHPEKGDGHVQHQHPCEKLARDYGGHRGVLAVAGPAGAARSDLPSPSSTVEVTMLLHGDFSTFISQVRPDRDNSLAFSGDAYINEMGIRDAASPQPRP